MSKMSLPKHHEFVNGLDYRNVVRSLYDKNIAMSPEYIERHNTLLQSNSYSFKDVKMKNGKAYSDQYNHVLGYVENCNLHNFEVITTSSVEDMFNFGVEYERLISGLIRKFATIYSLDIAFKKYKRFNDPIFALYDEPKNRFLINVGQQRYFYSKIFGIPLDVYFYSLGNSAANILENMFPDILWQTSSFFKKNFRLETLETSDEEFHRMHVQPALMYDDSRTDVMEEFQTDVMDFIHEFLAHGEEIYYYCNDRYIAFIPNKFASTKKKVEVKDVYGLFQHALWKYSGHEKFSLDIRFEESEF